MNNNIENLKEGCSGCAACAVVCPKKAVKISLDEEGFYTASINKEKCVDCGQCVDVCLRNKVEHAFDIRNGKVYAAQSKDNEVINTCSSGGIAYEMSKYAIKNNYLVVGVKYDYRTNLAKTIIVDNVEDLELLKGSKYLQSYTEEAFIEVVNIAKKNRDKRFLVFGTPCQIYGLASVLEKLKLRERFLLVDLFCHGVPSMLVWKNYLDKIGANSNSIDSIAFRDKTIGWHNFVMSIEGKEFHYKKTSEADLFYHAFFDNVLFSKACYDCKVRKEKTKADVRLGDYWGKRYQEREDGVSAVLVCSKAGKEYISSLENIQIIEETTSKEVMEAQSVYTYKTEVLRSEAFKNLMKTNNLEKTVKDYRKKFPMKKRMKLVLKEATGYLPDGVRASLRKLYKKI